MPKSKSQEFLDLLTETGADIVVDSGIVQDAVKSVAHSDMVNDIIDVAGEVAEGVVGLLLNIFE